MYFEISHDFCYMRNPEYKLKGIIKGNGKQNFCKKDRDQMMEERGGSTGEGDKKK